MGRHSSRQGLSAGQWLVCGFANCFRHEALRPPCFCGPATIVSLVAWRGKPSPILNPVAAFMFSPCQAAPLHKITNRLRTQR